MRSRRRSIPGSSAACRNSAGSLYAYGPQPGDRMNEHTPLAATGRKGRLRKRMWEQALAAGIRTVEVRGSDYIGKDTNGIYSLLIAPALEKGRAAWITGHLDMPHTFTFNGDMARTLVTLAEDERAWGRAWHVPSPPAVTIRELARRYAVAASRPPIELIQLPRFVMRTAGLVVPIAREMAEMDYQWYAPFHMDATETADTFGLTATDLDTAIHDQVARPAANTPARDGERTCEQLADPCRPVGSPPRTHLRSVDERGGRLSWRPAQAPKSCQTGSTSA
ncbi:hypothetical protein ACWED2_11725 [Amycolatopsis sp. NPDC005003]